MKIHDITVAIDDSIAGYDNADRFKLESLSSMANGDICNVTKITTSSHFATHSDAPKHFVDDGLTIDEVPLETYIGEVRVLDVTHCKTITKEVVEQFDIKENERIIFKTGYYKYLYADTFYKDYSAIDHECAKYLVEKKVKMIGIDYLSIEAYNTTDFCVHKTILSNNIGVLEGLDLQNIECGEYDLVALPLKLKNGDGAPARVILIEK